MSDPVAPPEELSYFNYSHLPEPLQAVSKPFSELAHRLFDFLPACAQRDMALQHLLIAKDAAVRAFLRRDRK